MIATTATATATFYIVVGGNDWEWRAGWPAQAVGGKVARIPMEDVERVLTYPNFDSALPWQMVGIEGKRAHVLDSREKWERFTKRRRRLTSLTFAFPAHEGTAVFVRPCIARATLAKGMRAQGVRTIGETDDNYFADSRFVLATRGDSDREVFFDQHARAMASMDANVFSTPWLRDRYYAEYRKRFGKLGLPEMHVCRNHIPRENWPVRVEQDGPLRVGFMGSKSHIFDIGHFGYAAIHAAHTLGCETVMIGYNPADPDPDVPDEVRDEDGEVVWARSDRSRETKEAWARIVSRGVGWVESSAYHRVGLPLDIGIAPLLANDFSLARSDSKLLEYAVSGVAIVAQRNPVYTSAGWRNEENCLLAGSQEEMARQVVRLVRDASLRASLVEAAQEMVREQRNEVVMAREWKEVLFAA